MGNLPLAVRLTAFQCLSGKWSLKNQRLEAEPPDMVRSREDWKAAGRIHVRGFYHLVKSWLDGAPRGSLTTAICYGLSLLPASGVPLMYIEFLVHALCPDIDDCQAAAHELKNVLTMSGLVQVTEDEVCTWMMHTVCQRNVHAVLSNYPQRSVVHYALLTTFFWVSCLLSGTATVTIKKNVGSQLPAFGLQAACAQDWLFLISHFIRSLEEKRLLEAQLEFYLLNTQKNGMFSMDMPKANIKVIDQRLLDLSSQARRQSANRLKTANPTEMLQVPNLTFWMPIYGLLNYEQGQTCPAEVVTLAVNSIRKMPTLPGRALTLAFWLLKFCNAEDHQAITNLVIKLKLSAPVLLQEFYVTGLPEYLGILSLLCSALLLRGEVSSAENLMSSIVVAAQKLSSPAMLSPRILVARVARELALALYTKRKFSKALWWWEICYSRLIKYPNAIKETQCLSLCGEVLSLLAHGLTNAPEGNDWLIVWIDKWAQRLENLKTRTLDFINESTKTNMTRFLFSCSCELIGVLGNSHYLSRAVICMLSDFLVSKLHSAAPHLHADAYSYILFNYRQEFTRRKFLELLKKFCQELSQMPPSEANGKLVFAMFMNLWPLGEGSKVSSRRWEQLASYLLCFSEDYNIQFGHLGEKIPFSSLLIQVSPVSTAGVIKRLKKMANSFKRKGRSVLAERLLERALRLGAERVKVFSCSQPGEPTGFHIRWNCCGETVFYWERR